MSDGPKTEGQSEVSPSRWSIAVAATDGERKQALRDLAASYWYCVYAWWRRTELEEDQAATATLACFTRWLGDSPPSAADSGAARMREWLPARLAELAQQGVELEGPAPMSIDAAWAERRYADEPAGEPDTIFQRRWALTVLEFTASSLQTEYAARGEESLFAELVPFAGFEPSDDARYASAARRADRSSGAMRKAVFDFRTRQREVLRAILADTVLDPAETDSELTTLLCAIDAPGAETAPLPSGIQALRPEEVLARAMRSVRMTGASPGGWKPPSDAEIARLFPEYEIFGLLGRGGMGAVYKARQLDLDRVVALKLLPLEVSADRDFAERFRREARAMAKLSHPHIITVFDFGTTSEGHLFFVMEFVEGANLHEMIRKVGFEPAQALSLVAQVCTALAYAHEKGIVHRDIKPANVMVDLEGQAKVADFGLVRLNDAAAEEAGQTVTGAIMGTPDYMAPEQKHGAHVDHRADIYSVGVMLYEMLCRETPQGAFDPPSKRVGCDPRIDKIVHKAMQQAPDRRYQSTQEMRVDVATALVPAIPKTQRRGVTSQPLRPVEPPRRGLPLFPLAFVLVLGVIGYLIYEKTNVRQMFEATPEITQPAPAGASTSQTAEDNPGPSDLDPPASAAALEPPAGAPMPAAPTTKPEATTPMVATLTPKPAASTPVAPAPTPAAPLSATGKWLAEQEPLWQAAYASEVRGPFEKGVADLKTQYRTALEKQLAAFAKAAKLDDAVAFRAERERMAAAAGDVPADDDAGTPAALKILRTNYRTAFTKLDTERFTKAKSVHARYDTLLTQSQTALTQKQRFDEALEMKATRERLSAAWLIPPAGVTPVAPTPSGPAQTARAFLSPAILKDGFTNILGMKFVPVKGTDVLFCVHETRRQDYAAYASQASDVDGRWQNEQRDGIPIGGENIHPAVGVSWDDAQAFCAWLSKLDGKTYRLPTDEEWSIAVGLGRLERRSKNTTPEMLSEKETTEYPWDGSFPPRTRDRAGNYADKAHQEKFPAGRWIDGYSDGFATTAPVMSFKPSKSGLYDLGGNVREWVDDWWNAAQQERAIRGSDWNSSGEVSYFLASYRSHASADTRSPTVGFRAVVENRLPAPVTTSAPPKLGPAGTKDAGGWEDLLTQLTPAEVEKTGHGWSLKGGELFSPQAPRATLPLPGSYFGTSYQVRVKLRQLAPKDLVYIALPVGARMVGFVLDYSDPSAGHCTGLSQVNGKTGKDMPGVVPGRQVKDTEPHSLEVTVRLDGANVTITTTLDTRPLYAWTGPTAALSQAGAWTNEAGSLALGSNTNSWAVSEVKVKRLDTASALARPAPTATPTAAAPRIAPPVNTFGPWQPLLTDVEWKQTAPGKREVVDGRLHLLRSSVLKPQPATDGAIRARLLCQEGSQFVGLLARQTPEGGSYKAQLNPRGTTVALEYILPGSTGGPNIERLGQYILPKTPKPGDINVLELRLQGDLLTVLVDGTVVIEARDTRAAGPGQWGITAPDGWYESVEVQTPPPAAAAPQAAPIENTLGMKFLPVPITGGPTNGQRVLFSVWETRVQDYAAFATETKREWPKPEFEQGPTHPAVMVSWDDAQAFCAWLTARERKAGKIGASEVYRLPSDHEWSCAVGIGGREDAAALPSEKNGKIPGAYPWGSGYPPTQIVGNYAGQEFKEAGRYKGDGIAIPSYNDGYVETAPVGSFPASPLGLHDLGGNACEWCEDRWDATQQRRVQRGTMWDRGESGRLRSSYRAQALAGERWSTGGFRCVLATSALSVARVSALPANKSALAKDADGWQDLLAQLTPTEVEQTGSGWRLENGALFSPDQVSALPLLGDLAGISYQVRVKLRQLFEKESFTLFLPVGDKVVGAALDGWPSQGHHSGLNMVDGQDARTLPGSAPGKQVNDSEPHDFEVTVRLAGANATITATLDAKPLFAWTGPTTALSVSSKWSANPPRTLALGTHVANWAVSEVKVKRLAAAK